MMVYGWWWSVGQISSGGGGRLLLSSPRDHILLLPSPHKRQTGAKSNRTFQKRGGAKRSGSSRSKVSNSLQLKDDFLSIFTGLKYGWPSSDFSMLNPDPIPGVSRHPTSDSQLQILGLASANPLPSPHWSSVRRELSYWLESGPSGPGLAGARRRRERRGGGVPPPPSLT